MAVDEAFFWSGRTDGIGGKMIAYEIAISKKGITLEGLIDRTKIMEQMPLWDLKNPKSIKIWQKTSQYFASLSSGKVRVILGTFVDEKSVWLNYELPALKSNIKVREIISIDPKTKVEKLIFKR